MSGADTLSTGKMVDMDNYFVVRGRMWSPKDQDYTVERLELTEPHQFGEFGDAANFFDNAEHANAPGGHRTDIKLELLHYRFGTPHVVRCRILFP